jgi:hypothetical protein
MEVQEKFLPRELHEQRVATLEQRILSVERTVWAVGGVAVFVAFIAPLILSVLR